MSLDREALLRIMLDQSEESLSAMEGSLLTLETQPQDAEALQETFRVAHTLKGDARSLGFTALGDFSHKVEDLLDALRGGRIPLTSNRVTLLLRAVDTLRHLLSRAAVGVDGLEAQDEALLDQVAAECSAPDGPGNQARPQEDREDDRVRPAAPRSASTLRVDIEKLDQLLTLTGEVAVSRGRLIQSLEDPEIAHESTLETQREADRLYLDLQELVMKLRMVAVGPTFEQLRRSVRDLAGDLQKEARLVIEGGDVEVDHSVLQLLRDPLTHMIRNALGHGIESPARRRSLGKDRCGQIVLRSYHDAGNVVVEVSDDGAGLCRERILERARTLGIALDIESLAEGELQELLFEPGFSTAESVTSLSGRGVGLDVVRRNVEALRGSVTIRSRAGEGTTLTIRLPLTLAIIEGLLVSVGGETYVVPLDAVVETLELPLSEDARSDGYGMVRVRDCTLPFVRLRHVFGTPGCLPSRENVVIVEHESGQAGLVVDTVDGQSQTVIKPLARLFRGVPGVSGSAVLGNGRVALILDVPGLLRREVENRTHAA